MGNLRTSAHIDRVDDHDVPIGTTNRRDLPDHPANFRVVHLLVFDRAGSVLLQHIADGNRSAGKWGSSVAGYVLSGERYAEAARRKLADELGFSDVIPGRLLKTSMTDLGATKFITVFEVRNDGPFALDAAQVESVRFIQPDELRREIDADPDRFTATFRHIWGAYTALQGGTPRAL